MTGACWPGIERAPGKFLRDLHAEAQAREWDTNALLGHISHESKFNPAIKNPASSASGLIQMIDQTARKYAGVSSTQLRSFSHEKQLPGIVKYFDVGEPLAGADFLLLGISRNPALLTAPDSRVLAPAGSRAAKLNPKFQDGSGAITVGSVRRHWDWWEKHAAEVCEAEKKTPEKISNASSGSLLLAILLFGGIGLARRVKKI